MLRLLSSLLLLLFFTCGLAAQVLSVSEEIPLRSDATYELIGKLGGKTLLLQNRNSVFDVYAFDERMREAWDKEIELDKRSPAIIGTVATANDFHVVYFFRQRGHTYLKAHRYDPAANLRDSVTIADMGTLFFTPNFTLIYSEDRSKALVYYNDQQNRVKAFAFDLSTMEPLWETTLQPPDFFYADHFIQMLVDNQGRMHLILERDNFRSRRKPHFFEIHTYPGAGVNTPDTYTIMMDDRLTYDVVFRYDNLNDQLMAGGLYYERDPTWANGFFYLQAGPAGAITPTLVTQAFSDELVADLEGEEVKENRGVREINIREVVSRRDGGLVIVMERNRQYERRTGAVNRAFYDGAIRQMVDYYYDEVIVLGLQPNGAREWYKILHKKQYSQDDFGAFSSFFLFRSAQQLRFLFNDDIRLENTVSEYTLDALGNTDRNSLFNTKNQDLRLRFRDALQVNPREVIIPSERRNRLRLVRLLY